MSDSWSNFDDLVMSHPEGTTIDAPSLDRLASAATEAYQEYSGLNFASESAMRHTGDHTSMGFINRIYCRSIENGHVWVGTLEGNFFAEETYLCAGAYRIFFDVRTGERISQGDEYLNACYYRFADGWSGPEWTVDEFTGFTGFTCEDATEYLNET